jgi:hypothetical protein
MGKDGRKVGKNWQNKTKQKIIWHCTMNAVLAIHSLSFIPAAWVSSHCEVSNQ